MLANAIVARGDDVLIEYDGGGLSCDQILARAEEDRTFFSRRGASVVLFTADQGIGSRVLYLSLLLCGITAAPIHASTPRKRLEAIASSLGATEIVTAPANGLVPLANHDFTAIHTDRDVK